jgi:aminopeptidase N
LLFFRILKHALNYGRKFTIIIHCLYSQSHSCYSVCISAFYRVLYDEENYKLLTDYLKSNEHTNIHTLNKAQLLDDSLNLARAGVLNYPTALDLTTYLDHETDYIPWESYFRALTFLKSRLIGTEVYDYFKVTLSI